MTPCPDDWHDTSNLWGGLLIVGLLTVIVLVCYGFSGVWP